MKRAPAVVPPFIPVDRVHTLPAVGHILHTKSTTVQYSSASSDTSKGDTRTWLLPKSCSRGARPVGADRIPFLYLMTCIHVSLDEIDLFSAGSCQYHMARGDFEKIREWKNHSLGCYKSTLKTCHAYPVPSRSVYLEGSYNRHANTGTSTVIQVKLCRHQFSSDLKNKTYSDG